MKKIFKVVLISGVIVLLPLVVLSVFIYAVGFSSWWLKFPEPQRSQIALAKMEGLGSGIGCRDNCLGEKIVYRKMIMDEMEKNGYEKGVGKLMLEQIAWDSKSSDYRRELVSLIRSCEDSKKEKNQAYQITMPKALLDYLNRPDGSIEVKSQILSSFPDDAAASDTFISNLLSVAQDKSKSYEERKRAMTSLKNIMADFDGTKENPIPKHKNIDYAAVCDILLTMSEGESGKTSEALDFKRHILNSMNGCLIYKEFYKEDFFDRLKVIFYEDGVHPGIQNELMTELWYYKQVNLEKYINLMKDISSSETLNKIIRSDASYELKKMNIDHEVVDLPDDEYEKLKGTLDFYSN